MIAPWRIEGFGPLKAVCEEITVSQFRSHSAKLLLASLALHPGELITRDALCERLWPEEEQKRQRNRLRWTLSTLRATLSDELFVTRGHHAIGLAPGTTSDVAEFDALMRAALNPDLPEDTQNTLLGRAELLHTNSFLSDLTGDWIEVERERRIQQLDELRKRVRPELPAHVTKPIDDDSALPHTRFFGREREQEALRAFMHSNQRLLTITGTGGLGKTRLVRETLLSESLLFVPMAALTEASSLFDLLRELLKLPSSGYGPVQKRVTEHLKTRGAVLLILDNAEHIAEGLAPLIVELLSQCPSLRLVVTSRRRLKLPQEQTLELRPLALQTAVLLFRDRARTVNPRFGTTPTGEGYVEAICKLLEGIPLALEIAAARALLVNPAQMHKELETRLRFLVRQRGAEPRQLSVRAALEWSYDLLSPQARLIFRQSGSFRGGFTLAAARFVFGDDPPVLNALEELVLHSLVQSEYDAQENIRYNMLELVSELAELLLKTIPADFHATRTCHADYYLLHARHIHKTIQDENWALATENIMAERANINATIRFAQERKLYPILTDLLHSLAVAYIEIGYWQDIDELLTAAEVTMPLRSPELANVFTFRAVLARRRGEGETAWEYWTKSLSLYQKQGNQAGIRSSKIELISQLIDENKPTPALKLLSDFTSEKELDIIETTKINILKSRLYILTNQFENAKMHAEEVYSILKSNIDLPTRTLLFFINYLCPIFRQTQDFEKVRFLTADGIEKALNNRQFFALGNILKESANLYLAENAPVEALQKFWFAHEIHRELGSRFLEESESNLRLTQEKYGHLPEVQQWMQKIAGKSWQELSIRSQLIPANDLLTIHR